MSRKRSGELPGRRKEIPPIEAAPIRKGARTRADVSPDVRRQLNAGTLEAMTLVEILVVDFARLMRAAAPEIPAKQIKRLAPDLGITRRMALGGELLLEQFGLDGIERFRQHRSDTVRGWTAYAVGRATGMTLADRLHAIRPLADDPNAGVREWAWIALRPHVAADLEQAMTLLAPWIAERTNIRRYAVEITRPRGVWCEHIEVLKRQPELGLPLLDPLHAESEKYVQDSVANWLNDAGKTRGDWVRTVCEMFRSRGESKHTDRIVRRALRSLDRAAE